MEEVKRAFKPEFLNRIDDIIVFDRLTEDNIKEIAKLMLKSLEKRLNANEINVTFTESAVSKIAKSGFDPVYGARPLRRAIQTKSKICFRKKSLTVTLRAVTALL